MTSARGAWALLAMATLVLPSRRARAGSIEAPSRAVVPALPPVPALPMALPVAGAAAAQAPSPMLLLAPPAWAAGQQEHAGEPNELDHSALQSLQRHGAQASQAPGQYEPEEEAAARLEGAFLQAAGLSAGPAASPAARAQKLASVLVTGGASSEFLHAVRAHVAQTFPVAVLRDLLAAGYRLEANTHVRQDRDYLDPDNDFTGGFHSHGPKGNYIVVAQKIKLLTTKRWTDSRVWENAINHEIGHALAYIHGERESGRVDPAQPDQAQWFLEKGLSESPAFREAWRQDFLAIPDELKSDKFPDGKRNMMYYFLHPDDNRWFQRARQETFAEGFDVLLRGPRSSFNYENFTRHFPRALAEIRRELGARYPGLFVAP